MKITVKGAGMYGCVIAHVLQERGHDVTVYERSSEIMTGASFKNFRRLHAGFHYPKSLKTARECSAAYDRFLSRYGRSCTIMPSNYWIEKDSEVSANEYADFLHDLGRPYEWVSPEADNIKTGIGCEEAVYDPYAMRAYFKTALKFGDREGFVIDCTYAESAMAGRTRFVTLLRLDADLPHRAQTVLYGPFCGVIPAQEGGFFLYHAGTAVPDEMIRDAARYFPRAITARVLDGQIVKHLYPHGNERPYVVQRSHENRIHILSGKIAQSVDCAEEVAGIIDGISYGADERPPETGFETPGKRA